MDNQIKYSTIDMPLRIFLNAYCDDDYSQVENFDAVYLEYCEAIGGKKLVSKISDQLEYESLKFKVLLAQLCMSVLSLKPLNDEQQQKIDKVFARLKSLNYHLMIPAPDLDNVEEYCKQIEGWVRLDVINLKEMQVELVKKLKSGKAKPSRTDFTKNLVRISAALKVPLTDQISVREYTQWVLEMEDYAEILQSQRPQHGHKTFAPA